MKRVFSRKKKKRSRLFFSTPYVLGITGEPGSGKTYVARQLARRHRGVRVLDADQLAQMLSGRRRYVALAPLEKRCFRRAQARLTRLMGRDSWTHEELVARAYREPVFLDRIETILHTELRRVLELRLGVFRRQGLRWVIFDCPLLFEGEFEGFCHAVLCCLAPRARMTARVLKRPGQNPGRLQTLRSRQWSQAQKAAHAETVRRQGTIPGTIPGSTPPLFASAEKAQDTQDVDKDSHERAE